MAGTENLGRRIHAPRYQSLTGLVEHAVTAPSHDGRGTELALGGGWLGRTEWAPAGVLAALDLLRREPTVRLGARAGLFAGTDLEAGNGTGAELRGEWNPSRAWQLGGRLANYDVAFRLPRPSLPEAGTRNYSLHTSLQPDPWLRLSASHSQEYWQLSGQRRSRVDNATAGVTTPSRFLRSLVLRRWADSGRGLRVRVLSTE